MRDIGAMTAREVLVNIKNYDLWEFRDYKLSKKEAEVIVEALREKVERDEREQAKRIHQTSEQ